MKIPMSKYNDSKMTKGRVRNAIQYSYNVMPGSGAGEWGEGHAVVYFVGTGGKCTQMINFVQCHHLLQEDTPKLDKRQGRLYGWVFKEC